MCAKEQLLSTTSISEKTGLGDESSLAQTDGYKDRQMDGRTQQYAPTKFLQTDIRKLHSTVKLQSSRKVIRKYPPKTF
jgi:hypothetical protein